MRCRPALFTIVLLFAVLCTPLAEEADSTRSTLTYLPGPMVLTEDVIDKHPDVPITAIEVENLTRVSSSALIDSITIETGDRLEELDLEQLQLQLFRTGLFESLSIYYQPTGEGYKLTLKVKERPYKRVVPYFSPRRGAVITGGATVDSNNGDSESRLLGTTVWQRGGLTGKMGYVNPQLYSGNGTFSLFFSGGYEEVIHSFADKTEVRSFSGYTGNFTSKLVINQNRKIQPAGRLEYEMLELTSGRDPQHELPHYSEMLAVGASLSYDTTYFIFYYREGSEITAQLSRGFIIGPRTGDLMGNLTLKRTFRIPERRNLTLFCKTGFNFTDPLHYNELFGTGFRILPNEQTIDRLYFSSASEYELPLTEPWFGTLTGYGFLEGGYYSPIEGSHEFFLGPGIGFRFYLQRVEEPVLGFNLGLNAVSMTVQAEFFFGMQF